MCSYSKSKKKITPSNCSVNMPPGSVLYSGLLYSYHVVATSGCRRPQFCTLYCCIAMCWWMYCEHASCHSAVLPCGGCTVNMLVATVLFCHVLVDVL